MHLILNDLSLQAPAHSIDEARGRMDILYATLSATINAACLESVLLVHQGFTDTLLAPGYTIDNWFKDDSVNPDLHTAISGLITAGPYLDGLCQTEEAQQCHVGFQNNYGLGLHLAVLREHPVASLAIDPFQQDPLHVVVVRGVSEKTNAPLVNFHSEDSVRNRISWLDKRLLQKPIYEHAKHHDPSSGEFRGGGAKTSLIPSDAREVYEEAISEDPTNPRAAWWGMNDEGYLYRYDGSVQGGHFVVHWNGSNRHQDGRPLKKIPDRVRDAFPTAKKIF